DILARRTPGGGWSDGSSPYRPKYVSTNWMMLVLSDLGLSRSEPSVRDACEYWMERMAAKNGGLGGNSKGTPHYCVAANMARAVTRMGYADDPRVRATLDWLVEIADPKGGWSCFGLSRNLDSWEAMSAFAAYPRSQWTSGMRECVGKGAEYFLSRELHQQGTRYAPWYRTHYPVHYYYDLLVGLDFMTELGYGGDSRIRYAAEWLRSRRRPDGAWNLDAVHPDVGSAMRRYLATHPSQRPIPFALETVGRPSKIVTLTAMKALAAIDHAAAAPEVRA
ncbi:MAG TPA: prenyltransferase/squalene oxidase repeat-containing protein, partial [Thermoplasmata archaeon]|nr:prenyltransferase/squalene oxidase repeat-containing protein [Thermoplasmata archaeon]